MAIDLASHYKDDLASKLELIRSAIQASRCISFHYYYEKGEADKLIEPCQIVFKWSDWYVFGFCRSAGTSACISCAACGICGLHKSLSPPEMCRRRKGASALI